MKDRTPSLAIKATKKQLALQVVLVFIVPVILIKVGIIPILWRVPFLAAVSAVLGFIMYRQGWKFSDIGVHWPIKKSHVLPYIVFTVLSTFIIAQFGEKIGYEEVVKWWQHHHFLYVFFIVSLFQEFLYRGYLIPVLKKFKSSYGSVVILNALLFMALHVIFPNLHIGLPLALIGGIGFAMMYMRYPDLILIIISHAIINFFAVLYGFFAIPGITY